MEFLEFRRLLLHPHGLGRHDLEESELYVRTYDVDNNNNGEHSYLRTCLSGSHNRDALVESAAGSGKDGERAAGWRPLCWLLYIQITRDILWFLLILVAAVVSFAQMFHVLLVPLDCSEKGTESNSLCNQYEYYIKVYSYFHGEFDGEDFESGLAMLLVIFFTFMVVIVLLNVLIAIVSDSYEKCLTRSEFLFGRARVVLLAELVSFQQLLRSNKDYNEKSILKKERWTKNWKKESMTFFLLSVIVIILWILGESSAYNSDSHNTFIFNMSSILVNVLLFIFIVFVLSRISSSAHNVKTNGEGSSRFCLGHCFTSIIERIMLRLMTTGEDTSLANHEKEAWKGQVNYLKDEMGRIAARSSAHTKMLIENEARISNEQRDQLEMRIDKSEARIMAQLSKSHMEMQIAMKEDFASIENRLAGGLK